MTKYCDKCEEPMARAEEATLIDGEILCLDCLPENQLTFEQFQATRKKVTAPYGYMDDSKTKETAFTYMGTFERFIEDSSHICIWTDEELIKKHGGKYWLILDRSEYNSNDLEQLEKMLFEFMQEN